VVGPRQSRKPAAASDRLYYLAAYAYIAFLLAVVAYPLVFVLSASFSSPNAVLTGRVVLWPVEPGLEGYKAVFRNPSVLIGYRNTVFYTTAGTIINVFVTLVCAFPLARKNLPHRGFFTFLFAFTMLFSGGMIPNYLLMRDLHLLNTVWVMLIPGAISVYNMIVARTYFAYTLPDELLEATRVDGCDDFRFFFSFALPLSKAIVAVIAMQYAVGHWNAFFNAFIYLSRKELYPLQIFLREILVQSRININDIVDPEMAIAKHGLADLLKYSLIVVATAPILCIYPFVQRYFVAGVMIGSLKG
jgi:putative aldouronate transport system permease protein